ncbi:hypothetical protein ACWEQ1_23615 [Streptomyces nodosus]
MVSLAFMAPELQTASAPISADLLVEAGLNTTSASQLALDRLLERLTYVPAPTGPQTP